jgi:hypothetical protein
MVVNIIFATRIRIFFFLQKILFIFDVFLCLVIYFITRHTPIIIFEKNLKNKKKRTHVYTDGSVLGNFGLSPLFFSFLIYSIKKNFKKIYNKKRIKTCEKKNWIKIKIFSFLFSFLAIILKIFFISQYHIAFYNFILIFLQFLIGCFINYFLLDFFQKILSSKNFLKLFFSLEMIEYLCFNSSKIIITANKFFITINKWGKFFVGILIFLSFFLFFNFKKIKNFFSKTKQINLKKKKLRLKKFFFFFLKILLYKKITMSIYSNLIFLKSFF